MMLIIFGGLPGTGKTSIARNLARRRGVTYLRIDSIEDALRESDAVIEMNDAGYRVAYAVAEDNLRAGRTVIADSVNPLRITRDAWVAVAARAGAAAIEVEITCSDGAEHRRRVESRASPTWQEVISREYHAWDRKHLTIDTAGRSVEDCVAQLCDMLPREQRPHNHG